MATPDALLSHFAAGQPRACHLLGAALAHGRLPHALMVLGAPSTPRSAIAQAFVQRLLCARTPPEVSDACGTCVNCQQVRAGTHPRLSRLASNERGAISVAQVRAACRALALRPAHAGRNVLWIEAAEHMAPPAQNTLLKTLEEPPGQALILLTVGRRQGILATIFSRVQQVTLVPPPSAQSIEALRAGGIDLPYAAYLAPWVGGDVVAAQAAIAQDLPHVVDQVHAGVVLGLTHPQLLVICQDLGVRGPTFELALVVLEVLLRDAMAHALGAPAACMTLPGTPGVLATLPTERLAAGIDALMRLRARLHLNINRVQALEGLLLTLTHRG